MKLFNAKLLITTVTPVTVNTWNIEGNVIDNYGQFMATDAKINDVIFNNSLNENTMEYNVCKYFISAIDTERTSGSFIACTIQWDEDYNVATDISTPIPMEESSIGTAIEASDFSALPPNSQGVSVSFVELASNIEKVQHTKNNNKKFAELNAKDTELQNTKANITDVNNELAKKSDLTYVNDELAKKANASDLPNKADLTYVNEELAKKANITDVNNELAKKSDLTYVNDELAKKSNSDHLHDDRYYTELEINALLSNKSNTGHTHSPSSIITDANNRFVTDVQVSTWDGKQNNLGFTPENIANKGIADGYASLDSAGKIPVSQIPTSFKEISVVADINARDAITDLFSGKVVHVVDATTDSSVTSGWAEYIYNGTTWVKTVEQESLDVVLDWSNVQNKPTTFAPSAHTHLGSDVTSAVAEAIHAVSADNVEWAGIGTKPTTIAGYGITDAANKVHTHLGSDVTSAVAEATHAVNADVVDWSGITNKPTTIVGYGLTDAANKVHTHVKNDIADFAHTHLGNEITTAVANATNAVEAENVDWAGVRNKPTTLAGYGITDGAGGAHNHVKANITDLLDATETEAGLMSIADKTKLDNIAPFANNYTHPDKHDASIITQDSSNRFVTDVQISNWDGKQENLGFTPENIVNKGIANGYASLDSNGVIPISQIPPFFKEVKVVADIAERDTITDLFSGKVVHVINATGDTSVTSGWAEYIYNGTAWVKTTEQESLDLVLDWANIQNKPTSFVPSTHTHSGSDITSSVAEADSVDWSGVKNKPTTLAGYGITDGIGVHTHVKSDITNLANVTALEAGLMSTADKVKLDGIEAGATKYVHPENHPASIIMQDMNNRFVTDIEKAAWNGKQDALNYVAENITNKNISNGYAGLDSNGKISENQIPTLFKEILVVANISARDTITDLFSGKTVYVIDATGDANVTSGWAEYIYTGGKWELLIKGENSDLKLDWGNITNKPTDFTPSAHNHNDLYNTKTEITTFLADKANKVHTHLGSDITSAVAEATHAVSADGVKWSGVTETPTTIAGYGITDAANKVHTHVKSDITNLANATTSEAGLLSTADKVKLDGIEAGATKYVHPDKHDASIITQDATHRFVTDVQVSTWDGKQNNLGFTPENIANKGIANGYASLDADSKIPENQIPTSFKEIGFVNTIADRDAITDLFAGKTIYVIDATGDAKVNNGWAGYVYTGTAWQLLVKGENYDPKLDWANILDKPTTFTPSVHNHNDLYNTKSEITTFLTGKSDTTHTHTKANITDLANATTSESGLLSTADKVKLDGIEAGATKYVHPENHLPSIITQDANNRFVTDTQISTWDGKQNNLGFTPEDVVNKGTANGYASLDANSKVPENQIPTSFKEISVVADITARDAITDLFSGKTVYVIDATGDSKVTSGWAEYFYNGSAWQLVVKGENSDLKLDWANILNKPATFTPSAHTHTGSDITSKVASASLADAVDWSGVTNKPTTLVGYGITDAANKVHAHVKSDITDLANATTSESGLLSTADKVKLDGIEAGATKYVHPENHLPSIITQDANNRFVTDAQITAWNGKQNNLGFTPENIANKGIADGYASLDSTGKIPVSQIPASFKEIAVVNTIADRATLTDLFSGKMVHVVDATGDATVTSGWAEYIYNGSAWVKTTEQESLDLVLDWNNIQNKPTTFTATAHTHSGSDITSAVANATTAETATKLATAREISLTGDVTATAVTFDGSQNAALTTVLSNTGATAGSYTSANITVDAKGRITAVANGISTMDYEPSGSTNKDVWIRATGPGVTVVKADVGGFYRATFTVPNGVKILSLKVRFLAAEVTAAAKVQIDWDSAGSTDYNDFMPPISQNYFDTTGNRTTSAKPVNYNINPHTAEITGLTAASGFTTRLIF